MKSRILLVALAALVSLSNGVIQSVKAESIGSFYPWKIELSAGQDNPFLPNESQAYSHENAFLIKEVSESRVSFQVHPIFSPLHAYPNNVSWTIVFEQIDGKKLRQGAYPSQQGTHAYVPPTYSFSLSSDESFCDGKADPEIKEIDIVGNQLNRFRLSFAYYCPGYAEPVKGVFEYNADYINSKRIPASELVAVASSTYSDTYYNANNVLSPSQFWVGGYRQNTWTLDVRDKLNKTRKLDRAEIVFYHSSYATDSIEVSGIDAAFPFTKEATRQSLFPNNSYNSTLIVDLFGKDTKGISFNLTGNPYYPIVSEVRLFEAPAYFPWKNYKDHCDVNADGYRSGMDSLILVNALNQGKGGRLPAKRYVDEHFFDVNGDGYLSSIDTLIARQCVNSQNATL